MSAQALDDLEHEVQRVLAVIRSIANDWNGERLVDWTGTNSNQRFYGTNGHHDVTWTADDTGAVTNRLRYDPWGNASTSGSSLPDFRFQGSWYHPTTDLSWVVTRWYAPSLGRFVSEDSLLGEPVDPPSRHLYAYTVAEPIARWDPDGRYSFWTRTRYFIGDPAVNEWNVKAIWACFSGSIGVGTIGGFTAGPVGSLVGGVLIGPIAGAACSFGTLYVGKIVYDAEGKLNVVLRDVAVERSKTWATYNSDLKVLRRVGKTQITRHKSWWSVPRFEYRDWFEAYYHATKNMYNVCMQETTNNVNRHWANSACNGSWHIRAKRVYRDGAWSSFTTTYRCRMHGPIQSSYCKWT